MRQSILLFVFVVSGCATATPPPKAPLDVSNVDVPVSLLQRHQYVMPKDASNDAFFAAHSENKGIAKLQDFQMELIEDFMRLSDDSGKKIKLHEGVEALKNERN